VEEAISGAGDRHNHDDLPHRANHKPAVDGAGCGRMFALGAATGKPIWVDQDLLGNGQGTFGIQPLVANGRVYLAGSIGTVPTGGILLALNAATGKLVWTPCTILPGSLGGVLSNLALAGNTVYVATVSNDLVFTTLYTGVLTALDRATGAIVYQRTLPTSANASIAIAGNSVLVPRAGLAFSGRRAARLSWWSTRSADRPPR
jgi:outer membrane protein assembly factor BamB